MTRCLYVMPEDGVYGGDMAQDGSLFSWFLGRGFVLFARTLGVEIHHGWVNR